MDSIQVTGIRAYGYVGYLPEERVLGQWFEVDLTLWVDLAPAGKSDNIEDTLDYREAIAIVKQQITTAKFDLVEKLADAIAKQLLNLEKVDRVRVELSKPAAPIPDFCGRITLDITRSMT
jgi:dihydroneopterin aldolase